MTDDQQFLIGLILKLENSGEEAVNRDEIRRVGRIGRSLGIRRVADEPYDTYLMRLERESDQRNRRAV